MITIRGIDPIGAGYEVTAGAGLPDVVEALGHAYQASYGDNVHGTSRVVALLSASDGEPALLTPTGPSVTLSSADERSVLAWLRQNTEVTDALGDLPGTAAGVDEQSAAGSVF